MKKSKLLAPLFGLATVAAAATPIMACGPKSVDKTVMRWNATYDSYDSGEFTLKAGEKYTFKLPIPANETDIPNKFGLYVNDTIVELDKDPVVSIRLSTAESWQTLDNPTEHIYLLPKTLVAGSTYFITFTVDSEQSKNINNVCASAWYVD